MKMLFQSDTDMVLRFIGIRLNVNVDFYHPSLEGISYVSRTGGHMSDYQYIEQFLTSHKVGSL